MNHLRVAFAPYWQSIQHALFPQLERVLGPLARREEVQSGWGRRRVELVVGGGPRRQAATDL